ncbi:hypothetical protein [Hyalangium versicolor]|uniref:hypothetical protein n=1 Tax=Hyalangium versicolor TaxID=2861190 RepID=UPI001CC9AB54|nr:hypothetical protein [Hyalangium versicolor]
MTQYVFRLATPSDRAAIHRLQEQRSIELNTPPNALGGDPERSEFLLVEAVRAGTKRAVGALSLTRASSAPFQFEQLIPDVWQRIYIPTLTGLPRLRRDELVELDPGYLERPHRNRQLTLLMLAGGLLHAQRRRYPVGMGLASAAEMARVPGGIFRGTGLVRMVAGAPQELGVFFPSQSVALMAEVIQEACAGDGLIPWHLDVS